MKVVFDESGFDEIDHFHPDFDESVPNPRTRHSSTAVWRRHNRSISCISCRAMPCRRLVWRLHVCRHYKVARRVALCHTFVMRCPVVACGMYSNNLRTPSRTWSLALRWVKTRRQTRSAVCHPMPPRAGSYRCLAQESRIDISWTSTWHVAPQHRTECLTAEWVFSWWASVVQNVWSWCWALTVWRATVLSNFTQTMMKKRPPDLSRKAEGMWFWHIERMRTHQLPANDDWSGLFHRTPSLSRSVSSMTSRTWWRVFRKRKKKNMSMQNFEILLLIASTWRLLLLEKAREHCNTTTLTSTPSAERLW